ncbi:MAG TPA: glycosyltransferase family 2 protein [Acidimicrobiales bacterium]|nr:glycosyltransferase family 2 protein [Acidimicrobiales bacterium]
MATHESAWQVAEPSGIGGRVAAVVVEYHSGVALERCIESLLAAGVASVVVVDNGDALVARVEERRGTTIRFVTPGRNLGFGGGVNEGARHVESDLLLVCNPDIVLESGSLSLMGAALDSDSEGGLVGPALLDESGNVRQSARAFPSISRSWRQAITGLVHPGGRHSTAYRAGNWIASASGVVDWVTGACMLVRRDAFDAVGGFDDTYFLYVEEVDLCWRLQRAGWRVLYEPAARVTHIGGVSTAPRPYRAIYAHHRSLWRFARLSASGRERLALPLVALALAARFAVACLVRLPQRN